VFEGGHNALYYYIHDWDPLLRLPCLLVTDRQGDLPLDHCTQWESEKVLASFAGASECTGDYQGRQTASWPDTQQHPYKQQQQ
jgi:hypothetical protein